MRPQQAQLSKLKDHPRNYKTHPPDQLAHIEAMLRQFGVYKNVVAARDWTILAGHGVAKAARNVGMTTVPVVRLDIAPDSPLALKILAGDNEIGSLAARDDRGLTEMLRQVKDAEGLLGTGFDDLMLANLVLITRPESEIAKLDDAAAWAGMPEYTTEPDRVRLVLCFATEADKAKLLKRLGVTVSKTTGKTSTAWWPPRPKADLASVKFEPAEEK